MKKVSVIIPAYNKAEFTIRAVNSVLSQTYGNIEIIVVDDGSTDDTPEKLSHYKNRIVYHRKRNGGACSARNTGIKMAAGEYIALLDCDDLYYPEKIQKSVACLEADPRIGFVYTGADFIDENDRVVSEYKNFGFLESGQITSRLLEKNIICNSTILMKKECFDRVGFFDEKIFIPADWDMWIRLSERYKAGFINENLTGYRVSHTFTINNVEAGLKEELYVVEKTFARQLPGVSKKLKQKCLSQIYYRYGLMNMVNSNFSRARGLFFSAMLEKPYDLKLGTLVCFSYVAPSLLQRLLKSKIVA